MAPDSGDKFGPTLTDFMSGVAVVFLSLAAVYIVKQMSVVNATKDYEQQDRKRTEYKKKLVQKLNEILKFDELEGNVGKSKCFELKEFENKVLVRFKEAAGCDSLNFKVRSYKLEGAVNSDASFVKVAEEVCKSQNNVEDKDYIDRIELLGHTDKDPFEFIECGQGIDDGQCGNLALSAMRAREVFMRIKAADVKTAYRHCYESLFKIAGRGPYDFGELDEAYLATCDRDPQREICIKRLQRRVEIVIYLQRPKLVVKK